MADARRARFERAKRELEPIYRPRCLLCEVRCGVDRAEGALGACGLADATPVYRRMVHFGEERELVPSYAVWLAGCNLLCSFCSDEHALRPPLPGDALSADELAEAIAGDLLATRYRIKNINFVGGDPSISLPYLADVALALLDRVEDVPPLLLNTNGYLTPQALEAAIALFDVFVVDVKFGNDRCARRIATPGRYVATLCRTLDRLAAADRVTWVRHLLMPDHLDCCTAPVLELLASYPTLRVNVMPAFVAFHEPWRSLSKAERVRGRELLEVSGVVLKYWDGRRMKAE